MVDRHLAEHRAFLDKYAQLGTFIVAGRKVPRTGGLILMKVADRQTAEAIAHEDPFSREGLATYEFIEFSPTVWTPKFEAFV